MLLQSPTDSRRQTVASGLLLLLVLAIVALLS
jgi:hypothetical protein